MFTTPEMRRTCFEHVNLEDHTQHLRNVAPPRPNLGTNTRKTGFAAPEAQILIKKRAMSARFGAKIRTPFAADFATPPEQTPRADRPEKPPKIGRSQPRTGPNHEPTFCVCGNPPNEVRMFEAPKIRSARPAS